MRSKLEELHLTTEDDYVLYYNGSMVANVGTGEIIHQQIIDGKAAKRVATLAQEFGLNTHAFSQIHGLITLNQPIYRSGSQHKWPQYYRNGFCTIGR